MLVASPENFQHDGNQSVRLFVTSNLNLDSARVNFEKVRGRPALARFIYVEEKRRYTNSTRLFHSLIQ
jgi:hypothetical protein